MQFDTIYKVKGLMEEDDLLVVGTVVQCDLSDIESVLQQRNLGEIVSREQSEEEDPPWSVTKEIQVNGITPKALHAIVHLSHVAVSAGVIDSMDTIGDEGIIHMAIHALNQQERQSASVEQNIQKVLTWLDYVIPLVPGFFIPDRLWREE